jgi:prolyl-tRNA editing enzyme YbaK/EbsC (Cys-tRNA(Pro) deacylase)
VATVIEYLVDRGTPFLVLPDPQAASIEQTAEANGIGLDEVVRCELVISVMGPSLMVIPAQRSLDLELARKAVRDPGARRATEDEIRSLVPDSDPDALPPLSLYVAAPMLVDPAVAAMDHVIFPAGRRTVLAAVQRPELFGDDPSVIVPLTRESSLPGDQVAPARRTALDRGEHLPPVHLGNGDDVGNGNEAPGKGGYFMTGR